MQIDAGFFAQLDRGEADVHVERQVLGAYLVEHRAGMDGVAQVAKLPDQFGTLLGRTDRVVQRHQAAPATGVHQEGVVVGVEQQGLVAGECEAAVGLVGGEDDLAGLFQFSGIGQVDHRAGGAQQPGQGHDHQQHGRTQQRAQAPWRVRVEGELPPQLMAVRNILIGEQQQPD